MTKLILQNDDATNNIGKDIAQKIINSKNNSIEIHLEGDLGAGKTFLTRSIIQNSGWQDIVKSPTYTLCEEYELKDLLFLHIDLYRTNEAQDIDIFDLERSVDSKKIIIIEWPERLQVKRIYDLKITFEHITDGREISITSNNSDFKEWNEDYK
ncbi:tRNA (adenosine(37)-N6)-threonylcarbamoyltransferase complex ATPase subunit type 1 TsaE [Gammaproteobacteria bacterium]|nr:tRNA (adenosine(37)-N6)-threonylcarbamoyltransferase complex ATPase subunit type 1 TsaE [Gammaproteobacteria bacterium]